MQKPMHNNYDKSLSNPIQFGILMDLCLLVLVLMVLRLRYWYWYCWYIVHWLRRKETPQHRTEYRYFFLPVSCPV